MLKSLLLVDDNDQMRGLLRSLVADLAENIYECRDGARAFLVKDNLLKLQEIISRQECGTDS
jgi:hypothetical protein